LSARPARAEHVEYVEYVGVTETNTAAVRAGSGYVIDVFDVRPAFSAGAHDQSVIGTSQWPPAADWGEAPGLLDQPRGEAQAGEGSTSIRPRRSINWVPWRRFFSTT
jgi:hypothetical protein